MFVDNYVRLCFFKLGLEGVGVGWGGGGGLWMGAIFDSITCSAQHLAAGSMERP